MEASRDFGIVFLCSRRVNNRSLSAWRVLPRDPEDLCFTIMSRSLPHEETRLELFVI